jgi:hypothetical protein
MKLNTLAGRSFNDLTQYPVFPHVLADYESRALNLDEARSYRDLTKPMGALNPTRLEELKERFKFAQEMWEEEQLLAQQSKRHPDATQMPFLYGSHYSSAGAVLHFLARLALPRLPSCCVRPAHPC